VAVQKKYIVKMEEVWIRDVEVDATSKGDARRKAANGEGRFAFAGVGKEGPGFEFSHSTSRGRWEVTEK
jgi:hypothetical protein